MDAQKKLTAVDIRAALRTAHPEGEYVVLFEVNEGTGAQSGRRADALVLNLWPSRSYELTGFEIKVSRADWLNELKTPAKADAFARYCDRWVIIAPKGVAKVEEMPAGWGLWEVSDAGRIRRTRQASVTKADPIPRSFLASLMRARAKLDGDELEALKTKVKNEGWKDGYAVGLKNSGGPVSYSAEQVRKAEEKLEEIKKATGIDLRAYRPAKDWIQRMKLADSSRVRMKLESLRDLLESDTLREQVRIALGEKA